MVWLHFGIVFLYFSLIEININIFTQIMNLTFSSGFATVGAFLSALFLAFEFVLLALLLLQTKEEMIKPEWMRDYAFTSATYLIRTNFKTITKYFWFFSCIKKILLAVMLTAFYGSPVSAIIGVCCVHGLYLLLAIYSEPFERKYLRIHFYLTEVFKMFVFICLLDFTSEYANYVSLISLTQIFYSILAFIFALHFAFIVANLVIERDVYLHFLRKKFMAKD